MKNIFFILFFIPTISFGQYYAGLSYSDTYQAMKKSKLCKNDMEEGTGKNDDGGEYRFIMGQSNDGEDSVIAYFKNSKCVFTILYPMTNKSFKYWVEMLNEKMIVISNTKWTDYAGGTYWNIELLFRDESDEPYFIIK